VDDRLSPVHTVAVYCRRKRPLSQKTASVAVFCDTVFCDSRRFRRQIVLEIGDYSRHVDRL